MSKPTPQQNLESQFLAGLRQGLEAMLESKRKRSSAASQTQEKQLLSDGRGFVDDWATRRFLIRDGLLPLLRNWRSLLETAPRRVDLWRPRLQLLLFLEKAQRLEARLRLKILFWDIAALLAALARYVGKHPVAALVFWLFLLALIFWLLRP